MQYDAEHSWCSEHLVNFDFNPYFNPQVRDWRIHSRKITKGSYSCKIKFLLNFESIYHRKTRIFRVHFRIVCSYCLRRLPASRLDQLFYPDSWDHREPQSQKVKSDFRASLSENCDKAQRTKSKVWKLQFNVFKKFSNFSLTRNKQVLCAKIWLDRFSRR